MPAYDGAEPLVADLMNVVERDYRIPRVLQHLVFHGQELHSRPSEPLSRFGIKNGAAVRLVGRMVPPDMIHQINAQYSVPSFQPPLPTTTVYPTYDEAQYTRYNTTGTQYDPPQTNDATPPPPPTPKSENADQPPATPK